ncbi:MAG: GTP-binding protein [Mariprofundaceae bacterium]
MRMRVFTAPRLHQALSLVRKEFGPEAIILDRQQNTDESGEVNWQVRAALDTPSDTAQKNLQPKNPATQIDSRLQTSMQRLERIVHEFSRHESGTLRASLKNDAECHFFDVMLQCGVSAAHAADIAPSMAQEKRAEAACLCWGKRIDPEEQREIILISGPAGAGKTTMIANLATHFNLKGIDVALVSTDTERIGGLDALTAYATALGIKLQTFRHPRNEETILAQTNSARLLLIDSEGWSQASQQAYLRQAPLWQALSPNRHMLLLPATLDENDGMALLNTAVGLNVTDLLLSRVGETSRIGKAVNWAAAARLPLSYCSFGPTVPDQLGWLNATTLATLLDKK